MNITVIGVGNAGTTVAADLTNKGHRVTLLKTSNALHNDNYKEIAQNKTICVEDIDKTYSVKIHDITTDIQRAMSGAELVIIYIQTNYHSQIIKKIAPFIQDGQTFLIEPGYLSTCYFLKNTNKDITIIEAESSPIDCRIVSPGSVKILFKNVLNPFGIYPVEKKINAENILKQLGYPYTITQNIIEAALHNPNLIVHTIGAIFSIPRIEYTNGEYWMYKEVFTPHVWNIVEKLDEEKMNVLERMGCKRVSYVEMCKLRNSDNCEADALSVFFDYAHNSSPKGPDIPDSRYITEDVPEGLVMLESLGKVLNVVTPVCSALIECASAALNRNFREDGRTVDVLGIDNIKNILKNSEV